MIIVGSTNADVGIQQGMDILKNGGSAMDAVEATIRLVEDNPDDHTVGYNSYPNILGDLQLDASIMDGATLETGAIAAMQGFREAISIARRVKDTLPHVLLAGEGAERFAAEMGFEKQADMLTDEIREAREELLKADMPPEVFADLSSSAELHQWVTLATDPEKTRGTVNVLARIARGICVPGYRRAAGPGNIRVGSVIHRSSVPVTTQTIAMARRAVPAWGKWPFAVRRHTAWCSTSKAVRLSPRPASMPCKTSIIWAACTSQA